MKGLKPKVNLKYISNYLPMSYPLKKIINFVLKVQTDSHLDGWTHNLSALEVKWRTITSWPNAFYWNDDDLITRHGFDFWEGVGMDMCGQSLNAPNILIACILTLEVTCTVWSEEQSKCVWYSYPIIITPHLTSHHCPRYLDLQLSLCFQRRKICQSHPHCTSNSFSNLKACSS